MSEPRSPDNQTRATEYIGPAIALVLALLLAGWLVVHHWPDSARRSPPRPFRPELPDRMFRQQPR